MSTKKALAWMLVAALLAAGLIAAPYLQADSGPPSGVFAPKPDAGGQPAAQPDAAAGVLPPGTAPAPPRREQPAPASRVVGDAAGLVGARVVQVEPAADLEAAGIRSP